MGKYRCLFTVTTEELNKLSTSENLISVPQELSQNLSCSLN